MSNEAKAIWDRNVTAAQHPPVTVTIGDRQVTLDFDPDTWVLVPRYVMASAARKKRAWTTQTAETIGARYGYKKRHRWTVTLANMLGLFTGYTYITRDAVLLRVDHVEDVAPKVRATTLNITVDTTTIDGLVDGLANLDVPMRRDAIITRPKVDGVEEAVCGARYLTDDDGDPYVSLMLGWQVNEAQLALLETVVNDADAFDAAEADMAAIAATVRVQAAPNP